MLEKFLLIVVPKLIGLALNSSKIDNRSFFSKTFKSLDADELLHLELAVNDVKVVNFSWEKIDYSFNVDWFPEEESLARSPSK